MQTRLKIGIPIHLNILRKLEEIARKHSVLFDVEVLEERLNIDMLIENNAVVYNRIANNRVYRAPHIGNTCTVK
jgi:hypothetical protein